MDIRVLGPLEVELDGRTLVLGGVKQRSVLAVLVLHAREVVGIDSLADAVWDGKPPASAETTLRAYVFNLRKALEPQRKANDTPRVLRTTTGGYVLDVPDAHIDARRFERLVVEGRRHRAEDVQSAVKAWESALAEWRGRAFQDFAYNEFVQAEAARLEELRLTCLEDLFDARLHTGAHETVVSELDGFCAVHPERERALALRMTALYRCGRQAEALRAYEDARRRLAEELGVDPSPQLRALHELILREDDALTPFTSGKRTLTFLLGDVERSTDTHRTLGDEYAVVLEEQRTLLRDAFEAHHGHAVRLYGDATFAAFDGASDAIGAAVAAQTALLGHALPLRMGLHTGEATFSGGEYVGLAINLAARIMDAAHGRQVVVSGATKELLEAEGRSEIFLDTGTHALKDIPGAVRLFQVVHPDLPRDFPPLRTRSIRNDNIPDRPTTLVGRNGDIEDVDATLQGSRVVTLTGVGGVGKTRLALEVASRVARRYPDGAWLCELAPVGDSDALIATIAAAVGARQQEGASMRDSLLSALRQRRSLVILDNCEHLLQPVAELVEDVVHTCPGVDVLATSREMLAVDGEHARPVRSLNVDEDAVRLFEDRSRAVRPDFTVDDATRHDVADICRRIDGIPLAIELAAARVTSMTPAQIAARLEKDFSILRSQRRTAVDRHRTLHAAIDWSYAMLTNDERLLFDRLSVFAGGFSLDAAEAVCGRDLDLDVADGLASLVAKSMVVADVAGIEARYTSLETIRQYAHDRLAARGEVDDMLGLHARYFAQWLEETIPLLYTGEYTPTVRRRLTEVGNLRAALAWAKSVGEVDVAVRLVAALDPAIVLWHARAAEVHGWAEAVAAMPGAEQHASFPVVLALAANDMIRRGNRRGAEHLARRAIDLLPDRDDLRRAWPLDVLLLTALYDGRLEDATSWNEESLRLARSTASVWEAGALGVKALIESYAGRRAAAVELAEKACALAGDDPHWHAFTLYTLAEVLGDADPARALDCLDRALAVFRSERMEFRVGNALVTQASLRSRHGDPRDALPAFRELVNHWRIRGGDWTQQWTTIRNLVELFARLGVDEAAAVLLAASEASATAAPSFGEQGERLETVRRELEERMGSDVFEGASERGRSMSDEQAVAYALAEIDAAQERSTPAN